MDIPAIDVSFSKDRVWAAFVRYPEIHPLDQPSGRNGAKADNLGRYRGPSTALVTGWSKDRFYGREAGKLWRIYTVDAVGGLPQEVKPDDPFDQGVPTWSADGRSLAFGELRDRKSDADMVIRVLDLATSMETILAGSKGKWSPRWSPDGRTILAQTTDFRSLISSIAVTNVDPSCTGVVGRRDLVCGRQVRTLSREHRKGIALFRVRVEDGKIDELALQPEQEYSWSGVAPDGSPLTLRTVKIEEIYALDLRLP